MRFWRLTTGSLLDKTTLMWHFTPTNPFLGLKTQGRIAKDINSKYVNQAFIKRNHLFN